MWDPAGRQKTGINFNLFLQSAIFSLDATKFYAQGLEVLNLMISINKVARVDSKGEKNKLMRDEQGQGCTNGVEDGER